MSTWCAADIGWVTEHSYIVYGPLCNGATGVIYEGRAQPPRLRTVSGKIIEDYGVTVLYAAPPSAPS